MTSNPVVDDLQGLQSIGDALHAVVQALHLFRAVVGIPLVVEFLLCLLNDPGHAVASKQVKGFGGMLGFETKRTTRLKMKLCKPWTSLGDVESLLAAYGRDDRRGIPDNYRRLSVGIEDPDDIIADLKQALDQA